MVYGLSKAGCLKFTHLYLIPHQHLLNCHDQPQINFNFNRDWDGFISSWSSKPPCHPAKKKFQLKLERNQNKKDWFKTTLLGLIQANLYTNSKPIKEYLYITLCNEDSGVWDISTDSTSLELTDTQMNTHFAFCTFSSDFSAKGLFFWQFLR